MKSLALILEEGRNEYEDIFEDVHDHECKIWSGGNCSCSHSNFEKFLDTFAHTIITAIREECVPPEKDISPNEVGTVGDYHTHGYNKCHDQILSNLAIFEGNQNTV